MSTWIGSSFISVFLLFMGGILIGHLLWYRDRSRDLQAVKDAEIKYNRAKAAARSRKRKFILLSRDVKSVELKTAESRSEADTLRQTLTTQTQRADSLESEIGKLQADQSRFELACRDAEKQRDDALAQAETGMTELLKVQGDLRDTETNLNQALTAVQEHAGAAESASSELGKARERCAELVAGNETLHAETRELRTQLETAETHRAQLAVDQNKLQTKCNQLQVECDELSHRHDESVRECGQISLCGERFEAEIEQLRSRCDELIAHRDAALQERDQAIQQSEQFAEQQHQLTRDRDQLATERDDVVRHRDQLVINLESLSSQHDLVAAEHNKVATEHELLAREHATVVEERNRLADRWTEESTQTIQNDEKFLQLQSEYDALRDQHAAAIAANRDQTSQFESHQAEFTRLKTALHESVIQVQTLQSEHDELLDQLDERTSRIQTAIDGRVTAETALSEMEARIESLLNELADANGARTHHEGKLAEVQSSGSELQLQAQKLHDTIRDRDQRIVEMEKQIAEQNTAINRHCAEAERLRSGGPKLKKLEEVIAEKSAVLTQANSDLQSHRDLVASLRREIENRDDRVSSLNEAQQQIRVQLADQAALIDRLEQELRKATARFEAAKQYEVQAAELQHQAVTMQDQAAAMQSHSEDLQKQLRSVSAELDASLDANETMQQRLRQIEGQLHENAIAMRDLRRKRANVPALGASPAREQNKAA